MMKKRAVIGILLCIALAALPAVAYGVSTAFSIYLPSSGEAVYSSNLAVAPGRTLGVQLTYTSNGQPVYMQPCDAVTRAPLAAERLVYPEQYQPTTVTLWKNTGTSTRTVVVKLRVAPSYVVPYSYVNARGYWVY